MEFAALCERLRSIQLQGAAAASPLAIEMLRQGSPGAEAAWELLAASSKELSVAVAAAAGCAVHRSYGAQREAALGAVGEGLSAESEGVLPKLRPLVELLVTEVLAVM